MRTQLLALAASALLVVAACGGGSSSATPEPSAAGPEPTPPAAGITDGGLGGTSWVGTKADPSSPADPALITIQFDDATLSASGGCNRMGGEYKVVDGVLTTGAMFMTEMACDEPRMAQDQWLSTLLNGAKVKVDGDTLTLVNAGTTLVLADERVARPDAPLEQTTWVLDGISDGSTASSVPAGVSASITIADGRAAIAFGCNNGGGDVEVGEGTLTFGPLMSTLMMCQGPEGAVEAAMSGVLQGEVPYAIEGSTLTITGANGTVLTFQAATG